MMESKFIDLDKVGEEARWNYDFLEDMSSQPKPVPHICVYCDSQSAIRRAQNSMYNGKSVFFALNMKVKRKYYRSASQGFVKRA